MNDEQQTMVEFVQWLPQNIEKFRDVVPEEVITPIEQARDEKEVVDVLNQLSQADGGKEIITTLFKGFQDSKSQMFKKGGKLAFGLLKLQKGKKLYAEDINAEPWTYSKTQVNPNKTVERSSHTGWHGGDDWGTIIRERHIETNPQTGVSDTTYIEKHPDMMPRVRLGESTRNRAPRAFRWAIPKLDPEILKFWNNLTK